MELFWLNGVEVKWFQFVRAELKCITSKFSAWALSWLSFRAASELLLTASFLARFVKLIISIWKLPSPSWLQRQSVKNPPVRREQQWEASEERKEKVKFEKFKLARLFFNISPRPFPRVPENLLRLYTVLYGSDLLWLTVHLSVTHNSEKACNSVKEAELWFLAWTRFTMKDLKVIILYL